jgi:Bacterial PH domain
VFHRQPAARALPGTPATATSAASDTSRPGGFAPASKAREVFRLASPVVLWWVWVAFAVANVADFAIQGASARFAIVVSAILATVTGLAYALAWRPRVIADQAGLVIENPFRDHHVPWGAIQTVDTGDWVQVHHSGDTGTNSSASSKSIFCWALYVSARSRRKESRPPRSRGWLVQPARLWGGLGDDPGYAQDSRLPEEAKHLASLPVAKAIAVRLDARARQERARGTRGGPVTARWAWPPLAAVTVPALALLIIALT